jgi:oligopeptide transport system substrate-binding protein
MKRIWIALLLLAVGCSQRDEISPRVLRLVVPSAPSSLDPRQAGGSHAQGVTRMLYEGLFRVGPDGEAHPAIAQSYDLSEDGKRYTFRLRQSCWSNGDPLTAHDFVRSWQEAMDPSYDTLFSYLFSLIRGADAAKLGKGSTDAMGVWAEDDLTLVVELEHPAPYFVDHLANAVLSPVHPSEDRVSNGPFILTLWQPDSRIGMCKNPNYWDAENVALDGLDYTILNDGTTAYAMFQMGELDVVGEPLTGLPLEVRVGLREEGSLETAPVMGILEYAFNCERAPFDNANIRRAFATAIDRSALVRNVGRVGERAALSILPSQLTMAQRELVSDGDWELAHQLFEKGLAEMELTAATFPKVVITYGVLEGQKPFAQAIQQQWEEAFGVTVVLEPCDWSALLERAGLGDFLVTTFNWRSWLNDPMYNLEHVKFAHWDDPTYAALLALADDCVDVATREQYLREAEEYVMQEMPFAPVYQFDFHFVTQPNVSGVYVSPKGLIDLKYAALEL